MAPVRDLIERFQAGDPDAVRALYREYGGAVSTVALAIVHDRDLAADVVQQTFVKAWRAAATFDPDRELRAVLQLFRRSNRIIYRYAIEEGPKVYEGEFHGKPFALFDDTVIAFGEKGEELFRTKVEEPFLKRPNKHINWV